MFGFRSRSQAVAPQTPHDVAVDALDTPLVPCNGLRGHWVVANDGRLEMRWDLAAPAPVTPLKPRRPIPPHGGVRRSA